MPRGVYVKTAEHGRALAAALRGNTNRLRHGESTRARRSPENAAWQSMRARCMRPSYPSYARYGGRGIQVCERWERFENFLADMGRRPSPDHSLDRINNDGNYEPGNCRWATRAEQQRNRRATVLNDGIAAAIRASSATNAELARKYGVHPSTIRKVRMGVSWT